MSNYLFETGLTIEQKQAYYVQKKAIIDSTNWKYYAGFAVSAGTAVLNNVFAGSPEVTIIGGALAAYCGIVAIHGSIESAKAGENLVVLNYDQEELNYDQEELKKEPEGRSK